MTVTFDCVRNYQKEMDFVSRLERDALKKGFVLEFEPTVETVTHDRTVFCFYMNDESTCLSVDGGFDSLSYANVWSQFCHLVNG